MMSACSRRAADRDKVTGDMGSSVCVLVACWGRSCPNGQCSGCVSAGEASNGANRARRLAWGAASAWRDSQARAAAPGSELARAHPRVGDGPGMTTLHATDTGSPFRRWHRHPIMATSNPPLRKPDTGRPPAPCVFVLLTHPLSLTSDVDHGCESLSPRAPGATSVQRRATVLVVWRGSAGMPATRVSTDRWATAR